MMNARELASYINYTNMERVARKIVVQDELAPLKDVAVMAELDVYAKLLTKYEVVMCADERILLIDKDHMDDFEDIAVYLSR